MWPLGQRIEPPSFDLNAEPLHSLDVDKRPPLIVTLANAQHHSQLFVAFVTNNPFEFTTHANVIKSASHIIEAQ